MSFRNAAVIVVARVFRLISRTGQVLMEIGARTVTSGSGIVGSSFTFFHYISNITNSSIVWTQNSPTITDFDVIGPGNINGAPTYLQMTADPVAPHRQAVVLATSESKSSGVGSNAALFMDNDDNEHPRLILYADYGESTPPFKSVGIRGELTSVATVLELGSPVVPIGSDAPNGSLVGRHYAQGAVQQTVSAGTVVLTVPQQIILTIAVTVLRDRCSLDISYVFGGTITGTGAADARCAIFVSGGSYGGGVQIPASFTQFTLGAAVNFSLSAHTIAESVETPGTVLTVTLQAWKSAAAGTVNSEAFGICGLTVSPNL